MSTLPSRRDIIRLIGASAATAFAPRIGAAQEPLRLPSGAIIRTAAAAAGVACIVDAGHPDMGRNFQFLKQLSLKSGMPIIAGTGYYTQPFFPPEIAHWGQETQINCPPS
jgi:predicted metal-dependent phosphotriesterase family hydrolase